jgi:hypothetical protein
MTATGNSKDHVLKLLKNLYGQKQAGRVWNSFLVDKLTSLGYTSLLIVDCVFFCGDINFMVYVDDVIFLGNEDSQLQQAIKEIQDLGLNIKDQENTGFCGAGGGGSIEGIPKTCFGAAPYFLVITNIKN